MPVYNFFLLSSNTSCLIWKIEESLTKLRLQLHPHFLTDFQNANLSSKDRIRQSLAVRIALYCLLEKLNLPILTLAKNEQGSPILANSSFYLSFTHTHYLAAVALSTVYPIGIDIEMVRSSLYTIQKKYLNAEEIENANGSLEKLAIYWSAKEALYKRLNKQPIPTFKDIFVQPFRLAAKGEIIAHLHQKKYTMGYQQVVDRALPRHVLVYCAHELGVSMTANVAAVKPHSLT
ncbi:4'-phosphopantetheinyl transferase superfamily [Cardinium endosymbiont cEper1 of Encarsia pergandiella]|uniref:4'-phosphopantetheinyl transferase family protein n=1 Tax=Cardinium endosymbiont of Encarsia pergandiella TaxID=249402 RepID=UPI00027EA05C|nr:4'-phosphopantetheinyl transferase family protein [Cardinium endosymbiont of Encarsia pergandiella]CCM10119.1 4'-phosphopantetheinyl transferase superfamily [Cardinium endosymbiont cEper1 of Encarsia pergandiella]